MLQKLRTRANHAEGFTLIELLIVITILGILAAIVVFAVGTTTSDAKTNACQTDVKTVQTAVEAFKAQTGAYPASIDALTGTVNGSGPWLRTNPGDVNYNSTSGAVTAGSSGNCAS